MTAIGLAHTINVDGDRAGTHQRQLPWQDYAADLQPRLDSLAAAKNCAGLQREFDAADANNAATRTRTGHSNTDLMKYINDLIEACP